MFLYIVGSERQIICDDQMMELLKWNQLMFSFSELIFKAQGSSVKQKLSLVTVA